MPSVSEADFEGCDLIIEAVFEDRALKGKVTAEAEKHALADAVVASNTSTLPITGLAQAVARPEKFIGLHFFSPVDKMPLVEIIRGEKTSDETLARGFDYVLQIKKTPIVVNDSRGFFTSRVFGTFTNEGIAMLGEGVSAAMIDNQARQAGMPVGPLAISDEVSLSLMTHIRNQTARDLEAEGKALPTHPAFAVIDLMVNEYKRPGKAAGAGFYDYPANGRKHLWAELKSRFEKPDAQISAEDVRDRLLFIQAIETVRCVEEGYCTPPPTRTSARSSVSVSPPGAGRLAVHQPVRPEGLHRPRPIPGRTVRRALRAAGAVAGEGGEGRAVLSPGVAWRAGLRAGFLVVAYRGG